ncbi:membrane bound serine racemase VanT [Anaerocolumna cellulosilytica]|uniref:Alanine racemase n=1 Tax=Anaerocolumna cellulosilytica TaxID=433286 RepID=A0A6S6QWL9_9FIRM|nr:serine racemase VanT catalytic subunit [Anaerocolumna cellulosilytica]MBB5193769.1 serine/alanine racemase [Anaerocolumna cellulosilytica]BCJ95014.1 membrane bound serine racemase VanT [Anaerocolumna cellulosilytica]
MQKRNEYITLDFFRIIGAFLIVAIHTSPLASINSTADFIVTRIFARIAVPFFLMVTGYFILPTYIHSKTDGRYKIISFLKKTCQLYGFAILLYLPIMVYNGYFKETGILTIIQDIFLNGTFYHLWYLPGAITGILLLWLLLNHVKPQTVLGTTLILYCFGLLGDSYFGLIEGIPVINSLYKFLFVIFEYTRNGLFYAPVFLMLGAVLAINKRNVMKGNPRIGLILSLLLMTCEGLLLHTFDIQRHDSMYVTLLPVMYYLFQTLLSMRVCSENLKGYWLLNFMGPVRSKDLRFISMVIYIFHPLGIILIRGFSKVTGLEYLFITNSVIHFLSVSLLSYLVAVFCFYCRLLLNKEMPYPKSRAWLELSINNLHHNVQVLTSLLPHNCHIMGVVKANAYGHGDIRVSRELNKMGISTFAVATIAEAIHLRKHKIKGDILVFGYTHPKDFKYLVKYNLTQTIVDYDYARTLSTFGSRIKVHIKIDTGMHRLGESFENLHNIEEIYHLAGLKITGIYSHLSVSDSYLEADITFTQTQISSFFNTMDKLEEKGIDTGKIHIQSSYGLLNYPELACDYARIGIALYGVLSAPDKMLKEKVSLKPVLSLKARVVTVKSIKKGETVSYGRDFTAPDTMVIAVVSIGYADGIPRNLNNGSLLIKGMKAPIVGRICMDQLMIDITRIPNIGQDDVVTIIGTDGQLTITAEEVAAECGTITNELLSRLSERLKRVFI